MNVELSVVEFEAISQIVQRTPLTQMEALGWRGIVASAQGQLNAAQVAEAEAIGAAMDQGDQADDAALAEQADLVEVDDVVEPSDLPEEDDVANE